MIFGKSLSHVHQGPGREYSLTNLRGYYNDLTEKVTKDHAHYNMTEVFPYHDAKGNECDAPIEFFQYGLGAYDLYLAGIDKELMLKKFKAHVQWAMDHQQDDGSWDAFAFNHPDCPKSAMAQGEGASLLLRAYVRFQNKAYLQAAKKALDFMLLPLEEGGTARSDGKDLVLYEFTCFPCVYNGWIFAIFGLMDYVIVTDDAFYKEALVKTINTLQRHLPNMDNGFWSMYREDKTIASPFYHRLHIAQLKILAEYTNDPLFAEYEQRFARYGRNPFYRCRAFLRKARQKIVEKD